MELKQSLMSSTYKQLSRGNKGWRKTYVAELPWEEMAIDVDSLVFFYMRKYLDIPYQSPKNETMVYASFLYDIDRSMGWMIEDMAKYSSTKLISLFKYLLSVGVRPNLICSVDIPKLKRDLYKERAVEKNILEEKFRALGNNILVPEVKDRVISLVKKYALHFRDDVRDCVIRNELDFHCVKEADKECAKYRVTMSEDVDIFLFGNKRTIIVKPFLGSPTHFDFIDCESYYIDKGIKSHADFIQVAFLIGTDYNRGIKRIGPKRSVKIITKYRTIGNYIASEYDITDDNAVIFVEKLGKFIKYLAK